MFDKLTMLMHRIAILALKLQLIKTIFEFSVHLFQLTVFKGCKILATAWTFVVLSIQLFLLVTFSTDTLLTFLTFDRISQDKQANAAFEAVTKTFCALVTI